MLLLVIVRNKGESQMSTFKDFLIGKEDKFYSLANDLVAESEFELEAVTKCVSLARDMNLLCVLGGAESISNNVSEAWYDANFEHTPV